jgi:hypothetical protein
MMGSPSTFTVGKAKVKKIRRLPFTRSMLKLCPNFKFLPPAHHSSDSSFLFFAFLVPIVTYSFLSITRASISSHYFVAQATLWANSKQTSKQAIATMVSFKAAAAALLAASATTSV